MSPEEENAVETLLAKDSSIRLQQTTLTWFANYFEECHILNLPVPRELLAALETFSTRRTGEAKLKSRAKHLIKTYR